MNYLNKALTKIVSAYFYSGKIIFFAVSDAISTTISLRAEPTAELVLAIANLSFVATTLVLGVSTKTEFRFSLK